MTSIPFYSSNDPQDSFALRDTSEHDTLEPDANILATNYCPVGIQTVVQNCTHLSQDQQNSLTDALNDFTDMFDSKLKHYPDEKNHLNG